MGNVVRVFADREINFAPQSPLEEVLQNVATIISTPKFTVPLDRNLGLSQRFIDVPMSTAQAVFIAEVIDAIADYEPRAEILSVTFEQNESVPGRLLPVVEVDLLDDNE